MAREVVADIDLTLLPLAPPALAGLANVRGELLPVLRTGVLLGIVHYDPDRPGPSRPPFAVVVDTAYGPAALLADRMPELVDLAEPGDGGTGGPNVVDVDELCRPERIA